MFSDIKILIYIRATNPKYGYNINNKMEYMYNKNYIFCYFCKLIYSINH